MRNERNEIRVSRFKIMDALIDGLTAQANEDRMNAPYVDPPYDDSPEILVDGTVDVATLAAALESAIREAQAEAWGEGWESAIDVAPPDAWFQEWSRSENPYRDQP